MGPRGARSPRHPTQDDLGDHQHEDDTDQGQDRQRDAPAGGRDGRQSPSGRSAVTWHSVQTQVRSTCLVCGSRRSVHGMKARRPQREHRSGRAPGGNVEGNHGTFAVIAPSYNALACLGQDRLRAVI
jgi:hypothetical protein